MAAGDSSFEDDLSIVIDNGSYKILAGFGGDKTPRCNIYCLEGKANGRTNGVYYGDKAYEKRSILDVKCPIQRGVVTDWEAIEKVLTKRDHVSLCNSLNCRFGNTQFTMSCASKPPRTAPWF